MTSQSSSNHSAPIDPQIELKKLPGFPITLFYFKKYDGCKALVVFLFALSSIYFFSGFIGFLIDHNKWVHDLFYGKPEVVIASKQWWEFWKGDNLITNVVNSTLSYIDIVFRLFIFLCAYCLTWATFDPKNIEGYIMGLINTSLGIIYLLSPLDIIPDILPVIGSLDDTFLGIGMVVLGISGWYRTKMREVTTKNFLDLVNHGNNQKALQLLLEDKGITIISKEVSNN
ncbi:YkvA family protein [Anabaena sp. CCY 9910]|uniref:YkvA family protein n=1 Tax=Anabaena sp. CCY 9910 TaxID=3103870 RepID=UPI0039E19441